MIAGIGIDMIEVERVAAKISREKGFREYTFSPAEIVYCQSKAHPYQHFAARFAAKEAFFKALGSGWGTGTAFNEVETLPDDQGAPQIRLLGETAHTLGARGIGQIRVSLTHLETVAGAVVIIEK